MKKAGLYIFSLSCLLVYALSLNKTFMEWWADFRTYQIHAPYAKARYGDLYSNSYLPGYTDTAYITLKTYQAANSNTDLYIIHDSYLDGKIQKENFKGLHKLVMADYRSSDSCVVPDTARRNILIIECSERTAEWRITDTSTIYAKINLQQPGGEKQYSNINSGSIGDAFFNPNINQNLEFALYDYEYFIPLKNLKAWINYRLFKRLPKDVAVSSDEQYLFLNETIDISRKESAFMAPPASYLEYVIKCANTITEYYRARGFDEVYFSIIPNPVSILDQKRMTYNHKIELLQDHPASRSKFISVYLQFLNSTEHIYRRDDSHWNGNGLQLWVDEVNKTLNP